MNWVQSVIEFLERFWPLVKVDHCERGTLYVLGKARRSYLWIKQPLNPAVYAIIPWFMEITTVSVVPTPISSPLLNITLRDGRTLSYSVTAIVRVTDPWKALNEIDDYTESTAELVASRVSEKLAEVDGSRVDPENRKRLLTDLKRWINDDTNAFGVEVVDLRFTNFAINQKAYRLLTDTALSSPAW